jgi:hypothetical protein
MKERIDAWLHVLRDTATPDGAWHTQLPYNVDVGFYCAFLLTTLALVGLAVWAIRRTVVSSLGRAALLAALGLLAALPVYVYVSLYHLGQNLMVMPTEFVAMVRFFPEQLATSVTQHRLAATGVLWVVLIAVVRCLGCGRPARAPLVWLGLVAALAGWPMVYAGKSLAHKVEVAREFAVGKSLFDTQCQLAGLTVHQKVPDVAGVRLGRMPQDLPEARFDNRDWSDAGIPRDRIGVRYIESFLDFDFNNSDVPNAGFSIGGFERVTMHGFRFVDIAAADGSLERWQLKGMRPGQGHQQEPVEPALAARYLVNVEPNDVPANRAHWVAGSRMTVTDTADGKLLGELRAFAYAPPLRRLDAPLDTRSWHWAMTCPPYKDIPGAMTRMAAQEVLTPSR